MKEKLNRRDFVKRTGAAFGAAAFLHPLLSLTGCSGSRAYGSSFGFQVWTIRKELIADFAGTLEKMAGLGYREVEMCSPLGYTDAGFGPLNEMSGIEMRKKIEDSGLSCTSSHFNFGELRDHLQNRIDWAGAVGMKQMILSSFWLGDEATLADYQRAANELNEIGEQTRKAGIQMGFHNHHMEFERLEGRLIYDVLLEEFDPDLVKMQFQVAVVDIGYHAADYFRRHAGRFISAHLADWSEQEEKQVPIGQGMVDWEDFFRAAKVGGVRNFYVEMAPETFEQSATFLTERVHGA